MITSNRTRHWLESWINTDNIDVNNIPVHKTNTGSNSLGTFYQYYAPDEDIVDVDKVLLHMIIRYHEIKNEIEEDDDRYIFMLMCFMEIYVNDCKSIIDSTSDNMWNVIGNKNNKIDSRCNKNNKICYNKDDKYIIINPHTNRYYANLLFKKMVDFCICNNFFVYGNRNMEYLIYPQLKNAFFN